MKLSPDELLIKSKPQLFLLEDPHRTTGTVFIDQSAGLGGKIRAQATTEERASQGYAERRRSCDTAGQPKTQLYGREDAVKEPPKISQLN